MAASGALARLGIDSSTDPTAFTETPGDRSSTLFLLHNIRPDIMNSQGSKT